LLFLQKGRGASKRGVSFQFGPDITQKFLQDNGLDYVIRSHEVKVIYKLGSIIRVKIIDYSTADTIVAILARGL